MEMDTLRWRRVLLYRAWPRFSDTNQADAFSPQGWISWRRHIPATGGLSNRWRLAASASNALRQYWAPALAALRGGQRNHPGDGLAAGTGTVV